MRSRNLPKLQPGDLVAGRFRIIEPIGSGGFSVVYRAHQEELNRFIALKILKPKASNDAKIVERFRREALYASHLSHPNTITLYDYGHTADNLCFIAMEYLQGMDLSAVVQTHRPMDLKRVWRILVQCSRSLSEAHKLGLVHRDLKPENIFLVQSDNEDVKDEVVKVLDFGVSKAVSGFGDASTLAPLTQEGTVFGTPLYMAPEQAMAEGISPAVDVYALGHIMFEMITGYSAYEGLTNAMDVMLKQINDPPLALPEPWDATPFSELITLCTQKDPEHRVQSASILLEHLLSEPFARWADPFEMRLRTVTATRPKNDEVITEHLKIENLEDVYPEELLILNRAFEETMNGAARLVLIHGTPGSGRSNLLRGFVDQRARFKPRSTVLHRSFDSSLTVSGLEYELSLLSGEELEGRGIDEVRRLLKKIYGASSEFEVANLDSESKPLDSLSTMRDSLFSQIGNPFRIAAKRQPIVWALENLERLDTLTLAFLERFLRELRLNEVPILIVATVYSNDLQRRQGVAKYSDSLLKATPLNRQIFLRSESRDWPAVEDESYDEEPPTMRLEVAFEDMRTDRIQTIADPESPFDVILGHLAQLGDEIPSDLWKLTHARILDTKLIGAVDTTLQQADKFGIISVANDLIRFTQAGYSEMLRDAFEMLGGSAESHVKIATLLEEFYPHPTPNK